MTAVHVQVRRRIASLLAKYPPKRWILETTGLRTERLSAARMEASELQVYHSCCYYRPESHRDLEDIGQWQPETSKNGSQIWSWCLCHFRKSHLWTCAARWTCHQLAVANAHKLLVRTYGRLMVHRPPCPPNVGVADFTGAVLSEPATRCMRGTGRLLLRPTPPPRPSSSVHATPRDCATRGPPFPGSSSCAHDTSPSLPTRRAWPCLHGRDHTGRVPARLGHGAPMVGLPV